MEHEGRDPHPLPGPPLINLSEATAKLTHLNYLLQEGLSVEGQLSACQHVWTGSRVWNGISMLVGGAGTGVRGSPSNQVWTGPQFHMAPIMWTDRQTDRHIRMKSLSSRKLCMRRVITVVWILCDTEGRAGAGLQIFALVAWWKYLLVLCQRGKDLLKGCVSVQAE